MLISSYSNSTRPLRPGRSVSPISRETAESNNKKPRLGGGPAVAVCLILLPVLYVLSEGPVAGLVMRGYLPQEASTVLYAPLNWVAARSNTLSLLLEWYESFWFP